MKITIEDVENGYIVTEPGGMRHDDRVRVYNSIVDAFMFILRRIAPGAGVSIHDTGPPLKDFRKED